MRAPTELEFCVTVELSYSVQAPYPYTAGETTTCNDSLYIDCEKLASKTMLGIKTLPYI